MTDSKEEYVIHALPPYSMIKIIAGKDKLPLEAFRYSSFAFRNSDGVIEDWTLVAIYSEGSQEQVETLLPKAWRWYRSYMEWEDKQIDNLQKDIEDE